MFFFKQKTAYEMRSSDSDVCSSDLRVGAGAGEDGVVAGGRRAAACGMGDVPGLGMGTGTRRQRAAGDAVVAAAGHDGVLAGRGVAAVVGKGVVLHRGVAARGIAAGGVPGDPAAGGIGVGAVSVVSRLGPSA